MKHLIIPMFSEQEIKNRVYELAKEISNNYRHRRNGILLIGLLRGAFIFIADLCRKIDISHEVDFMIVSSYGHFMSSTGDVKILKDLDRDIYGKDILIVEDIIDSGNTISKVYETLKLRKPRSLTVCTLLEKNNRPKNDIKVEYIGFSIEDEFVVGFGIDYAYNYRYLPYIGKINISK